MKKFVYRRSDRNQTRCYHIHTWNANYQYWNWRSLCNVLGKLDSSYRENLGPLDHVCPTCERVLERKQTKKGRKR